jgi:hypothetical protein
VAVEVNGGARVLAGAIVMFGLIAAGPAFANDWRLVPTVGARGGGSVNVPTVGDDNLDIGLVYGLTANRILKPETALELTWLRHDTGFNVQGANPEGGPFGLTVDTIQIGGVYSPVRSGKTRPFVAATMGVHWYDPEPASFGSEAQLSMAISGGWEFRLSDRTALRLTGRGWFLLQSVAISGICGGVSCNINVSGSGGFQLEGTLGLAIDL